MSHENRNQQQNQYGYYDQQNRQGQYNQQMPGQMQQMPGQMQQMPGQMQQTNAPNNLPNQGYPQSNQQQPNQYAPMGKCILTATIFVNLLMCIKMFLR